MNVLDFKYFFFFVIVPIQACQLISRNLSSNDFFYELRDTYISILPAELRNELKEFCKEDAQKAIDYLDVHNHVEIQDIKLSPHLWEVNISDSLILACYNGRSLNLLDIKNDRYLKKNIEREPIIFGAIIAFHFDDLNNLLLWTQFGAFITYSIDDNDKCSIDRHFQDILLNNYKEAFFAREDIIICYQADRPDKSYICNVNTHDKIVMPCNLTKDNFHVHPNAPLAIYWYDSNSFEVWNLISKKIVRRRYQRRLQAKPIFDPGSMRIALHFEHAYYLRIVDSHTGDIKTVSPDHTHSPIMVFYFNKSGTQIASQSENGTILLWDSYSGQLLNKIYIHEKMDNLKFGPTQLIGMIKELTRNKDRFRICHIPDPNNLFIKQNCNCLQLQLINKWFDANQKIQRFDPQNEAWQHVFKSLPGHIQKKVKNTIPSTTNRALASLTRLVKSSNPQ